MTNETLRKTMLTTMSSLIAVGAKSIGSRSETSSGQTKGPYGVRRELAHYRLGDGPRSSTVAIVELTISFPRA
jgi:hypothetical protein